MIHRFRPHVVRLAAGILFTFSLFPSETRAAEPPAFKARFENDAEGMWLVYPTVAGWHYKLESSPTPGEVAGSSQFSFVPGSFRYGSGLEERWWIAPPAAVPAASLPPRTTFFAKLGVHVSNNTTPPEVEIVSYDAQDAVKWSTEVPGTLPVPLNRSLFVLGDSSTTTWLFVGQAESMPIESFHGPSVHVPGSPHEAEIAFVLGHWDEILGDLTPTPDDALLNPPQVPYGGTVPLPDPTQRRFYRAHVTQIDSNNNGLPDWWELEYGYSAFAGAGAPGYADPDGDTDGDGLKNLQEYNYGTKPNDPDSDDDLSPDGEEVEQGTGPTDEESTPSILVFVARELTGNVYNQQPPAPVWAWLGWGRLQTGPSDWGEAISIFTPAEQAQFNSQNFVDGFPDFESWAERLQEKVPFPEFMPWAPVYDGAWSSENLDPRSAGGNAIPAGGSAQLLRHQRLWLRGSVAPPGGRIEKMILVEQRGASNSSGVWTYGEPEVSEVIFTTAEGQRVSAPVDLLPALSPMEEPENTNPPSGAAEFVNAAVAPLLKLSVDANMDGHINAGDDVPVLMSDGSRVRLAESDRGLILDINNNNSDAGSSATPDTKDIHDHLSPDLDGAADITEIISTDSIAHPGHLSGKALITLPVIDAGRLRSVSGTGGEYLWIRRSGDPCVRVHLSGGLVNAFGPYKRRVLGVPGDKNNNDQNDDRTGEELNPSLYTQSTPGDRSKRLELLLEGVSAGICELIVEHRVYDPTPGSIGYTVKNSSKVRIQVNVDQLPDTDISKSRAISLTGRNPHYAGMDFGDILPASTDEGEGIIALRGRFRAEIPAARKEGAWRPQLTHRQRKLRLLHQAEDEGVATASFWFGINSRQVTVDNISASCWIQAGLFLWQGAGDAYPNINPPPPGVRMYLETGRIGYLLPPTTKKYATEATGGVDVLGTNVLRDWQTKGIAFDFVLFQDRDPSATTRDPWVLVCHDVRSVDSTDYIRLECPPPIPGNENEAQQLNITTIHKQAIFGQPEFKTELTNSASFLFGNQTNPAIIEQLEYARTKAGANPPRGASVAHKTTFDKAMGNGPNDASYDWQALHPRPPDPDNPNDLPRDVFITRRTGHLKLNGRPVDDVPPAAGAVSLDFWRVQRETILSPADQAGLERLRFYDARSWGFTEVRR